MIGKLSGWDDTIVALATPPGLGAIAVIRVSGTNTFSILNALFTRKDLTKQPSHTIHIGFLKEEGKNLDEVVLCLFKGPHSYTGEDVIEVSCHGSPFIQQQVMQAIIRKGARLAKPGEFTMRAFLNGKLDLTQAEAVADLIASNSEVSAQTALNNIRGGFSVLLKELREELLKFSSLLELELDFSEEDVEFADRSSFTELLARIQQVITQLISSFRLGNVIKNGVTVAIVGKPNAGKSTLLNALLNEERAIVSDIAGTTRDTIEEILNIQGLLFRLIDTAGIREHTSDVIEGMGVERSLQKIQQSDIVLYVFDAASTPAPDLKAVRHKLLLDGKKAVFIGNKADLLNTKAPEDEITIYISAKTLNGISEVKDRLFTIATGNKSLTENIVITNARHLEALQHVESSLNDIQQGFSQGLPPDLLTPDIRKALHYLGEITGEITNEDRLDFIFSKFCIGK